LIEVFFHILIKDMVLHPCNEGAKGANFNKIRLLNVKKDLSA